MSDVSIQNMIYSNEFADLIVPLPSTDEDFFERFQSLGAQVFGGRLGMVHIPINGRTRWENLSYSFFPSLFALLDTTSLEVSGILRFQAQPNLAYKGDGVLLGFIDTGIDYTRTDFRFPDGRTRILGIWDQTIPSDHPPFDLNYGTAFTREEIDMALRSESPLSAVPTTDTNGHGTFLAGVAAGSSSADAGFTGAAPESMIAMVKLKPAKQYLTDYFLIREGATVYQETDIMMGLRYLVSLSVTSGLPLVICIGLGTNQGDHNGTTPLDRLLNYFVDYQGCFCAVAAGNEAGMGHHFYSRSAEAYDTSYTEILVDEADRGFTMEVWADSPNLYSVSVTSPLGESIPAVSARQGLINTYPFLAERTILEIRYEVAEYASGGQLIQLRFLNPTPGIWRLSLSSGTSPAGAYHMWLPVTGLISPNTVFLQPDPFTTLTAPSAAQSVITVSTYSAYTGSLYIHSSRGFTRDSSIKPDLAAPGVDVYGPVSTGTHTLPLLSSYTRNTGSSAAAAITAGAIALLINWGMDRPALSSGILSNRSVKNYLTRGAQRQPDLEYPNREWGYGTLNIYGIFQSLM